MKKKLAGSLVVLLGLGITLAIFVLAETVFHSQELVILIGLAGGSITGLALLWLFP